MPYGFDFMKWSMMNALKPSNRDKRNKHRKGIVCCHKCGYGGTLRKIDDKYICNKCYKELQNERR